jgi:hypothetical protein
MSNKYPPFSFHQRPTYHVFRPKVFTNQTFFFLVSLGGERLSPLGTSATVGLLYQPRIIDDDDYGAVGGMRIGRGNRSARRKPAPVRICPPQIPHDLTWDRTRAASVVSQRLTAWAMARPLLPVNDHDMTNRSAETDFLKKKESLGEARIKWIHIARMESDRMRKAIVSYWSRVEDYSKTSYKMFPLEVGAACGLIRILKRKQEVLGRANCLLSLIRHGPHWKRCVQQFFYCCVRVLYRGNIFTEPLPSNDRGIHIQTDRRDFFKLGRWDWLRCRDIHTKFHKDWFRHSKVNRGDTQAHTHTCIKVISLSCFMF